MKILWFPRIQPEIGKLHLTTWREMCRELETMGCTVKIAVTGKDEDNILERDVIRIHVIRMKFFRILSYWFIGYVKFIYHMATMKPDLVILDISSIWFSLPFALVNKNKRLFIIDERTPRYNLETSRNSLQDRIMKGYTKLCYWYSKRFLNGTTVITSYFKDFIRERYGYPPSRVEVWGSGVDTDKFSPSKCDYSRRPAFLKDKFVIMQHGELSFNRGIMETIEALKILGRDDVCMVLVGAGIAKKDIDKKVRDMKLDNTVYVFPPVSHDEIVHTVGYCDCAVMAYPNIEYWYNNNPIKLLEYLALGKVVLCTDMWTFRDVTDEKKCAYYIYDNSPNNIANAINYLYEHRQHLNDWGKEGVRIVRDRFTWHGHAKTLLQFAERLKRKGAGDEYAKVT